MRKIFIDAGAYNGDSIDKFREMTSNHSEYDVYAFEPNVVYRKELDDRYVTVIDKAVWIEDGEIDFFIGRHDGTGSTLLKDKASGEVDYENPEKVECIDLDKWIKETFTDGEYIILKMDIEGAEFEVIPHMMKNGSFPLLSEIWVEFHPNKIRKYKTTDKINMIKEIEATGVVYKNWH